MPLKTLEGTGPIGAYVVAMVLAMAMATGTSAHGSDSPPRIIPEVVPQKVLDGLLVDPASSIFGQALKTSGLHQEDMSPEVTFIVPRDRACSEQQATTLRNLDQSAAKQFVLAHAFKGQLAVSTQQGTVAFVNYFPGENGEGRQTADGSHQVTVTSFAGRPVTLGVSSGQLLLDGHIPVEGNRAVGGSGGSYLPVTDCGSL